MNIYVRCILYSICTRFMHFPLEFWFFSEQKNGYLHEMKKQNAAFDSPFFLVTDDCVIWFDFHVMFRCHVCCLIPSFIWNCCQTATIVIPSTGISRENENISKFHVDRRICFYPCEFSNYSARCRLIAINTTKKFDENSTGRKRFLCAEQNISSWMKFQ